MNTPRVIILAAGLGSRLYPFTEDIPKCLLDVGQKSILQRNLDNLHDNGLNDIHIAVGYKSEKIKGVVGRKVKTHRIEGFSGFNNLHTLYQIKDLLDRDVIIMFADVLYDPLILKQLIYCKHDIALLVDRTKILDGTMGVKVSDGVVKEVGSHIPVNEGSGNFIGFAKFSTLGCSLLLSSMREMITAGHKNSYYIEAINYINPDKSDISFVDVGEGGWIEVDTHDDYIKAIHLFGEQSK